jgi:hypothetical protein
MIENQQKILYGLNENRDVFFSRTTQDGGSVSLGHDNYRVLKLFISNGGRYTKGAVIAITRDEYSIFIEKSTRIAQKMKVRHYKQHIYIFL